MVQMAVCVTKAHLAVARNGTFVVGITYFCLVSHWIIVSFEHGLYVALPVEYLSSDFAVGNRAIVPIVLNCAGTQL